MNNMLSKDPSKHELKAETPYSSKTKRKKKNQLQSADFDAFSQFQSKFTDLMSNLLYVNNVFEETIEEEERKREELERKNQDMRARLFSQREDNPMHNGESPSGRSYGVGMEEDESIKDKMIS